MVNLAGIPFATNGQHPTPSNPRWCTASTTLGSIEGDSWYGDEIYEANDLRAYVGAGSEILLQTINTETGQINTHVDERERERKYETAFVSR